MATLTKQEKAWVRKLNKLLAECPSNRIAFATTGDCDVTLFDMTRYGDICDLVDTLVPLFTTSSACTLPRLTRIRKPSGQAVPETIKTSVRTTRFRMTIASSTPTQGVR